MAAPLPPRNEANADKFFDTLEKIACFGSEDYKEIECFCLEDHKNLAVTLPACHHQFHLHCIRTWIYSPNRGHNRCPKCRIVMFDDGLPLVEEERERWQSQEAQDAFDGQFPPLTLPDQPQIYPSGMLQRQALAQAQATFLGRQRMQAQSRPRQYVEIGSPRLPDQAVNYAPQTSFVALPSWGPADHSIIYHWPYRFTAVQYPNRPSLSESFAIWQPTVADGISQYIHHSRTDSRPPGFAVTQPMPLSYPSLPPNASLLQHLTVPHGYRPGSYPQGALRGEWPYQYPWTMRPNPNDTNDPGCYRLAANVVRKRR